MLFPSLQKGISKVNKSPQLLWTVLLAVVIIVAFFIIASLFTSIARDAQERLFNVRIGATLDALVPVVESNVQNTDLIQETIDSVSLSNNTIGLFQIGVIDGDEMTIVASLDKNQVGNIVEYKSFQSGLALQDPGNSYTFELQGRDERLFQTVRAFQSGSVEGIIVTEQTLSEADRQISSALSRGLIIFVIIMLVVLILFLRHSRIIDYISLYKKLKQVDQFKDDFISMTTHELRTPLTVIRGYIDLIKDDKKLSNETSENVGKIDIVSNQLTVLIEDMLEVSRIEQGRLEINKENLNARAVITEVVDSLKMSAREKHLKLILESGEDAVINVDRNRLRQILTNIVGNAVKYTKEGEIKVTTEKNRNELTIRISDTGLGMSQEEQERLFEKFYRVKNKETAQIRGTGLGLWITKQLVEKMGGKISVESIKGVGTHFIVTFPSEHE